MSIALFFHSIICLSYDKAPFLRAHWYHPNGTSGLVTMCSYCVVRCIYLLPAANNRPDLS